MPLSTGLFSGDMRVQRSVTQTQHHVSHTHTRMQCRHHTNTWEINDISGKALINVLYKWNKSMNDSEPGR